MSQTTAAIQHLWFLDTLVSIHVPHSEGADGISVIESRAPHGGSPPLHVHHSEDELFHVLEGELRFRIGDQEMRLGAGESFLAPKGVPHTYRVESVEGGRWLVVTTRGDFERFVRSIARQADHASLPDPLGPPSEEQARGLAAAALEHRIELVGPPLH